MLVRMWSSHRKAFRYFWDCSSLVHIGALVGASYLYALLLPMPLLLKDYFIAGFGVASLAFGLMGIVLLPIVSLWVRVLGGDSDCIWIMSRRVKDIPDRKLPRLVIGFIWTFVVWAPAVLLAWAAISTTYYLPLSILLGSMSLVIFLYGFCILLVAISEAKNIGFWGSSGVSLFLAMLALRLLYPMMGYNIQKNELLRTDKDYFHEAVAKGNGNSFRVTYSNTCTN